jgi:hypothetical protein
MYAKSVKPFVKTGKHEKGFSALYGAVKRKGDNINSTLIQENTTFHHTIIMPSFFVHTSIQNFLIFCAMHSSILNNA